MCHSGIEHPPRFNENQQEDDHSKGLVEHERIVIPPVVEGETDHVPA